MSIKEGMRILPKESGMVSEVVYVGTKLNTFLTTIQNLRIIQMTEIFWPFILTFGTTYNYMLVSQAIHDQKMAIRQ